MNGLRVLQMIDKPSLGGGQTAVFLLASNLGRSEFDVSVCSGGGGPLVDALNKIGVRHHEASFGKKHWRKNIRDIRRILKMEQIDILHTHGGIAGFFGRWAARRAKTPVLVHTLHGIHYLHYRNPILKRTYIHLEKDFSRFTDKLVLVSEGDRALARRYRLAPEAKLAVVKNGLDLRGFPGPQDPSRPAREFGIKGPGPVIGTVARLHRQKGVIYLIRAAARIKQAFPGAKVVCAGGGPLRPMMARTVKTLGLEDTVVLLGDVENAASLISLFDVFVLPSLWEGLPFVLIEAAALGQAIVATNVDGNKEIISDGETGLLVPAKDPEALAAAILRLLQDKALASRLRAAAQGTIPPRYTLSSMIRETERLYLSTWKEKNPS